jgi:hypothetical protein
MSVYRRNSLAESNIDSVVLTWDAYHAAIKQCIPHLVEIDTVAPLYNVSGLSPSLLLPKPATPEPVSIKNLRIELPSLITKPMPESEPKAAASSYRCVIC